MYLHWKTSSLLWFFIYSQCYTMLESKNPPYILIVIRFNVNRFQCYSMLIQKILPLYFHGPSNFALGKCQQQLISQVFICYTPSKYQDGAVLRPIPMLIFLNFIRASRLVVCTCYFDRSPFVN